MVDYIIANGTALGMIDKIMIDDYLPRLNLRNYHSHLLIQTHYGASIQGRNPLVGETCYRWVPGMEKTWVQHTSTTGFVDGLATTVGGDYATMDLLNAAVEYCMLRLSI